MSDQPGILCAGALHFDRLAKCLQPFRAGVSNPVRSIRRAGGVAHNIAGNLCNLGSLAGLLSMVGKDPQGEALIQGARAEGLDVDLVAQCADAPTADYVALLDVDGELAAGFGEMIIYDRLDAARLRPLLPQIAGWPVWVLDGNLPEESLDLLLAHKGGARICAAPVSLVKAERWRDRLGSVDLYIGNGTEATTLTGLPVSGPGEALVAARALRQQGPQTVVVTLAAKGAVMVSGDGEGHWLPPETRVVDVNGCGDSFFAGFVRCWTMGRPATEALAYGLALASLTAEGDGPVRDDIEDKDVRGRMDGVAQQEI